MTVITTTTLSDSIRTQYLARYMVGAMAQRVYDQLSVPYTQLEGQGGLTMKQLMQSSAIQVNFLSDMTPGVTAISETADITPQTLGDTYAQVTWVSRGEALQWSEKLDISVFTDYTAKAYEKVGQNMMESVELLAEAAALKGTWVERAAARASLDAGTVSHRASDSLFRKYHAKMLQLRVPGFIDSDGNANTWMAIMHPYAFHDIAESGNVNAIGVYQDRAIHLNFELGQIGPFRLVVTPFSKVFGGAGADNATSVATTLNGAVTALATTVVTAADVSASITAGELWTIGTEEASSTFYPDNEQVKIISASTVTLTILGSGPNGGLRYPHATGVAVRNADSVYPIVFGGPQSIVKVYAEDVGEYGSVVGPKTDGLLDQFNSLGWKYYGGYGRIAENRLLRYECSVSYEA